MTQMTTEGTENQAPTPGLVGFKQLARELEPLGVPASWLLRQAKDGKLPMLKMGQRRLFDVDAVRRELLDMASKKTNGAV